MDLKKQQQLIRDCTRNKRKAQNELFRYYSGLVMSISMRYSSNKSNSEDVFQECFIQIFKSLSGKKKIENLDRWVSRVAINTNISCYYKSGKHTYESVSDEVLDETHEYALDRISNEELLEMIKKMPDGYRVIFNMYFIDGYTHSEIAERLEISESTSRSQLTRSREYLKKKLELIAIYKYEAS